jgi:putative DNA primase/helicase
MKVKNAQKLAGLTGLDFKGDDGYITVCPSAHITGGTYQWLHAPGSVPLAPLPDWLSDLVIEKCVQKPSSGPPAEGSGRIPEGQRNSKLASIAGTMRSRGLGEAAITKALLEHNAVACDPPLSDAEVTKIALSICRYEPSADEEYHPTDSGNAQRLVDAYGHLLRHVPEQKAWYAWDGRCWKRDIAGQVYEYAKKVAVLIEVENAARAKPEDQSARAKDESWKQVRYVESATGIRAMVQLAMSIDAVVLPADQFDRYAWILNLQNGMLDLKTGQLLQPDPYYFQTKLAPVKFDPEAQCPLWMTFLNRILAGNAGLMQFLQRLVGLSLTADASEQLVFFLYGMGANGKSTFVSVVSALLGDYAVTTPPETFLAKYRGSNTNDIARMKGARCVTTVEMDGKGMLTESLIKRLTGGDRNVARFLYQEFIEFDSTFKLLFVTNHKPKIVGTEHATWRRIRLIPFTVEIPEPERDKDFTEKLKAELPGILNWALKGCLDWQREGLGVPVEVEEATREYREEMDVVAQFLAEICVLGPELKVTAKELYGAYVDWCKGYSEEPLSRQTLAPRLKERGFHSRRDGPKGSTCWHGLGLLNQLNNTKESGESSS